ncbi:MAG: hypothetical protein A2233_00945 [Candidatus Kerfeldbacteria bacterium RIFOXYA2_FULL_38_24]|uniref:NADH-ubiquinone oxidoreductase 51kDa subunit iron-sulphur binding domain-containing protein n=1 Tax=Candidatus Kerfeldbacteria bacterium RIFOXYB2_FULL_38_14 TaxID=1798547 RepID=A0A1G2BIJ4_9BACT|nr:MAG: hypothetical protein A2233_00945 [Candidatus Kerfeldbacteria bacterium RIFOXYA2_FULL_38_24]OGY88120.1 MAG: hypothetical protein A2319_01675 [Candidatus Kerfeldbacteria bacterium RIFOXYB2_FULL_38_14]OGY89602.1 MAG: hypothetical protein A2458_04140 [Candidatus Kerfeldbacteria bacterium RIFOXYC2_FULL_38_9]
MNLDLIQKIAQVNLLGRGGAAFPTAKKWEMVKNEPGKQKYVICNVSEGEPKVYKDGYILENYPQELISGILLAMKTIGGSAKGFLYLRKDYYQKYQEKFLKIIGSAPIEIFCEPGGYLGGDESAACEAIEGRCTEPRQKPPYPTQKGLWGCPTLINNAETLYYVDKIFKNSYKNTRLYSVNGNVEKSGVYEFNVDLTIAQVLKENCNFPKIDFFVQVGGGASGRILLANELDQPVSGAGSITVYDQKKTDPYQLMQEWSEFFVRENCDKCTPCREGTLRIREMVAKKKLEVKVLQDLFFVLEQTSFCSLGKSVPTPFYDLLTKVMGIKL